MVGDVKRPPESGGRSSTARQNNKPFDGDPNPRGRQKQGPTHRDRVLRLLEDHYEVCSSQFYRAYLPRFSVQIHQLRRQGYVVSKRPCDLDYHDHDGTGLYRLDAKP